MFLTRDQCRDLDRRAMDEAGMPGVVLMENAGRSIAELLIRLGIEGPALVCCGRGNNGGDGFVIARHLDNTGYSVRCALFARPEDLRGDAALNYQILTRTGIPIEVLTDPVAERDRFQALLKRADWVVDALFGSGLHGPIRPPWDEIITQINASPARVLAVDIPSGLDSDTGQAPGATIRAQHTATVAVWKKGFLEPSAREWLGQVHLIDMGCPRRLLTPSGSE
jgi:NAD(P)H-hydrate epimerase